MSGEGAPETTFDDFPKVDIRIGTVVEAVPFPDAEGKIVLAGVDGRLPDGARLA